MRVMSHMSLVSQRGLWVGGMRLMSPVNLVSSAFRKARLVAAWWGLGGWLPRLLLGGQPVLMGGCEGVAGREARRVSCG